MTGDQIAPPRPAVTGDVLDYDDVLAKFDDMMEWLARTYVHAMNCIHYMHDKYFYERLEMALHDRDIYAPWRSALPACRWWPTASRRSNTVRFTSSATRRASRSTIASKEMARFPQFGNNDDRVDTIAADLVGRFMEKAPQASDLSRRHCTPRAC